MQRRFVYQETYYSGCTPMKKEMQEVNTCFLMQTGSWIKAMKLSGVFNLVLVLFFCSEIQAQDKKYIAGRVFNGETGAAIPNASVFITNTSKGTVTSVNGTFELKGIPAGKYDLIYIFGWL